MAKDKQALVYALSAIVLWSTVATAFKIALEYVNFAQLVFFASGISVVIFFIAAIIERNSKLLFSLCKKTHNTL